MLVRVAFGVGLVALGYFVGREVGRNESLRRELDQGDASNGLGAGEATVTELRTKADRRDSEGQPER